MKHGMIGEALDEKAMESFYLLCFLSLDGASFNRLMNKIRHF